MLQHPPIKRDIPALLAFCASAAVALAAQWPGLTNSFVANDDVRQQLYWMQRWLDPDLYPPDILNDYARLYVSWGMQALYRVGCLAFHPLFFSKLVAVALEAWLGALLFQTGRALKDEGLGLATLAVFWLMPAFMENISGGLARAFAAPLFVLFLSALVRRSRLLALAALLAQALFIPYILLLCLMTATIHWAAWRLGLFKTPPLLGSLMDILVCLTSLGLAVAWQSNIGAAGFGPLPWAGEMTGRPEFYAHGRLDLLPFPSLAWELAGRPWGSFAPFRDGGIAAGIAATCLLLPALALGARRVAWKALGGHAAALWSIFIASLVLYALARIFALKLFVPSRYLEYTTNIFLCLGVAVLLDPLIRPLLRRAPQALGGALLLAALVLGAVRQHGVELYDYSGGRALYAFARTTPKTSRFAGHPEVMDNVLTFGQRNVYASFELAHPWSGGYWAVIGPRLERLAKAYYATDPGELRRFCQGEGIDFFVVDRRHYTPEFIAARPFFEPFGSGIRQRVQGVQNFAAFSGQFNAAQVDANTLVLDMRPVSKEAAGQF
jgi:hypothetical protein